MQINNIFSIGHRCNTDDFMKIMEIRDYSSPFSWMVIDIETSLFFIENKFKNFTDAIKIPWPHKYKWRFGNVSRSWKHTLFINKTFNSLGEDDLLSNWKRMCVWVHHDLESEATLKAFEKRQSRLLRALEETPETTLLFYIEQIKSYDEKKPPYDIDLINKFVQKYNCKFLLLIPLLNYDKDIELAVDTDNIKIVYYKSDTNREFPRRHIRKDEVLENLQNKIFSLYNFNEK